MSIKIVCTQIILIMLFCCRLNAAGMIQPGFYLYDLDNKSLHVSAVKSGLICDNPETNALNICQNSRKILITGNQICAWSDEIDYPCTRFGYQFNYSGANQGDNLTCVATFTDTRGRKTNTYQHDLTAEKGFVFFDSFKTFAEVDTEIILSETHECAYQDQPLMAIEFIHYYEPKAANRNSGENDSTENTSTDQSVVDIQPAHDQPHINTLPNTCQTPHLDETTAEHILDAEVRSVSGTEHIPTFRSACIYRSESYKPREVAYSYQFMLKEMFDVDALSPEELQFNASFAGGGSEETKIINNLGKKAFVYSDLKRTTIQVITGIDGPNDSSGRPRVVVATYYFNDGNMSHEDRLNILLPHVRADVKTLSQ